MNRIAEVGLPSVVTAANRINLLESLDSKSQLYQDCIALQCAKDLRIDKFFYVEVGANHAFDHSNTALLEAMGYEGISFDLEIDDSWQKRKNPIVSAGVGLREAGKLETFYYITPKTTTIVSGHLIHSSVFMSTSRESVEHYRDILFKECQIASCQKRIDRLDRLVRPDTLAEPIAMFIDVESRELDVIRSAGELLEKAFVVIAESNQSLIDIVKLRLFMYKKGFRLKCRVRNLDDVFVKRT